MTAAVVHRLEAHLPWHCDPNFIACRLGHVLRFKESNYAAELRGLAGHAFFECRTCRPATFFLAVFVRQPSPMVTCYALAEESYHEWATQSDAPATIELLHLLRDPAGQSLNPRFRAR